MANPSSTVACERAYLVPFSQCNHSFVSRKGRSRTSVDIVIMILTDRLNMYIIIRHLFLIDVQFQSSTALLLLVAQSLLCCSSQEIFDYWIRFSKINCSFAILIFTISFGFLLQQQTDQRFLSRAYGEYQRCVAKFTRCVDVGTLSHQ